MKKTIIISILAAIAFVVLCIFVVQGSQNTAISLEEQVNESKSTIEVQQKRRYDLFINLADAVKSYSKHESETLINVIKARGGEEKSISGKDVAEINTLISAVAESYPNLKSDSLYKDFMLEMSTTENKIAAVRDSYNTGIKKYNRYVRKFPARIFLDMTGSLCLRFYIGDILILRIISWCFIGWCNN